MCSSTVFFIFLLVLAITLETKINNKNKIRDHIFVAICFLPIIVTLINQIAPAKRRLIYGVRAYNTSHFKILFEALDCRIMLFSMFLMFVASGVRILEIRMVDDLVRGVNWVHIICWFVTSLICKWSFYATT